MAEGTNETFERITDRIVAEELHLVDQQRREQKMLDDYIDGVTYTEVGGELINDRGELYEPIDSTPVPGAGEEFLAEQRALALGRGETPPASLDELMPRLPEVVPLTEGEISAYRASFPQAASDALTVAPTIAPARRDGLPAADLGIER